MVSQEALLRGFVSFLESVVGALHGYIHGGTRKVSQEVILHGFIGSMKVVIHRYI